MTEFLHGFDSFTMAFMVAVLYLSLSAVLVYTALCRRTYPGFGSMALAQVSWSVGLFLNYFRPFETLFSLYLGALLMQFYGVPATARASLAFYNTREEIDAFVAAIARVRTLLA